MKEEEEKRGAGALPHQLGGEVVLEEGDVGVGGGARQQRALNLGARGVGCAGGPGKQADAGRQK